MSCLSGVFSTAQLLYSAKVMDPVSLETNHVYFPPHFCIMLFLSPKNISNLSVLSYEFCMDRVFFHSAFNLLLEFSLRNHPIPCSQPWGLWVGLHFTTQRCIMVPGPKKMAFHFPWPQWLVQGSACDPLRTQRLLLRILHQRQILPPLDLNLRGRKVWSYWLPSWNYETQAKWRVGLTQRK